MDLKKIAGDLVSRVESIVNQNGGDTGKAGRIDTENEKSIFEQELNKLNVTEEEANEIWGLALSETAAQSIKRNAAPQTRAAGAPIVINVNNEINWYININIDVNLSKELQELIDKLIDDVDNNFEALMDFLKENGAQNTNVILAAIKELFNAFEASNDKDHAELMKVLNEIVAELEAANVRIENLEGMIADLVNNSFEVLEMMGVELDAIKKALEESNKNQEEQIAMLALINETILQLTNKFNDASGELMTQLNNLLNMVGKNGVTLENIEALLETIKADTSEDCEIGKEILALIEKNGKNDAKFKNEMLKLLKSIKADTSEGCEIAKEILASIEKNGIETANQLTNIYNAIIEKGKDDKAIQNEMLGILKAIKDDTGKISETNMQILDAIKNLDASMVSEMTRMYNLILQQGDDVNANLEKFYELLKNIEGAINNLDSDLKDGVTKVIDAINNKTIEMNPGDTNVNIDLTAIEVLLNQILKEVQNNTEVDKAGFQAILDKLAEMGNNAGQVDLSVIEDLLADIKELTEGNGEKLNNIINNQDTIIMFLKNFQVNIEGKMNQLINQGKVTKEQLDDILSKLDALIDKVGNGESNCDVDGATLMDALEKILKAIEDGSCNCNCDLTAGEGSEEGSGESSDESITEDLDEIFGARARMVSSPRPSAIDGVQSENSAKDGKFIGPDGKIYIRKNGEVFDLSGRKANI